MTTTTAPTHPEPLRTKGWLIAGVIEGGVGLLGTTAVLSKGLSNSTVHHALLYLSGLAIGAGMITIAATLVAMANASGHEATASHLDEVAAEVARNGQEIKRLREDLATLEERIEGVIRPLTFDTIEELKKSSSARYEALADQLTGLAELMRGLQNVIADGYVDQMSSSPGLRAVPLGRGRRQDPIP